MADKRISQLPYLPKSGITSADLVPLVTYYSAVTGDTVHTYMSDLQDYLLTGVSFSDVYVTGGTYNKSTGIETFTNSTGGTFTVTGITDYYVTGGTYVSGTSTLTLYLKVMILKGRVVLIGLDYEQEQLLLILIQQHLHQQQLKALECILQERGM